MKSHGSCVLFVKRSDTDETVASLPVSGEKWQENVLHFSVPEDGNYRVGLGRGDARDGDARMRGAFLVNHEAAEGHVSAEIIRGMAYFQYSDDLFRRP